MISLGRTTDYALIREIVTHPRIYPAISDDFSPRPEDWRPIKDESVWYVLVKDGDEALGLWAFVPHNRICWEVHTCLLPKAYGLLAREAVKLMHSWLWENTECLRVTTEVPVYNRQALRFAIKAGMKQIGINEKSFMKNGKLHDVIVLGISRPGVQ